MNKDTLGFLIYCNRLDTDLTQEIFANDANITRSTLVRIEQGGIKNISDDNIGNVLELIGTSLEQLELLETQLASLLHAFFIGIITDNVSLSKVIKEVDDLCASYHFIIGDINYLLIKYVNCYLKSNFKMFIKIDEVIIKALSFMSNEQLVIYYDIKGLYEKQRRKFSFAKDFFLKAQSNCLNEQFNSIVMFHLGKICISMDDYFEAMDYYNKAMSLFAKTLNYQKQLYAKMDVATIYAKIGDYNKALETYQVVLNSAFATKENDTTIAMIKRNMAAIYLYQGNYDDAIATAEASFAYSKEVSVAYFQIAFSLYMNNDMKKALYWIDQADNNCTDTTSLEFKMLHLLKKVILKKKDVEKSLVSFYNNTSFEANIRYKIIILYLLIEYYENEVNDIIKANEYYMYLSQTISSIKIFDKIKHE